MRYLRTVMLGLLVLGVTQVGALSPGSASADSVTIPMGDDLPNAIPGWFCDPSFWLGNCQTTVTVGDSVTWVYPKGGTVHTATACGDSCDLPTGSPIWDSGFMFVGDTFTWTFDTPGTYLYYCTLHRNDMRGTIIVESQPTPTPTPTPPPTPALTPTPAPTSTHAPTLNPTSTPTPPQAVLPVAEGQSTEVALDAGQTPTSGIALPTAGGTPPRSGSDVSPWTPILAAGGLLALAGVAVLRLGRGGRV